MGEIGIFMDLDLEAYEIFAVANLLKRFFRQLPTPILKLTLGMFRFPISPPSSPPACKHAKSPFLLLFVESLTEEINLQYACKIIQQAPKEHQIILHYLIHFLQKVLKADNRMTAENIALMFGPAIFGDFPDYSPFQFQTISPKSTSLTKIFINTDLEFLFPVRIPPHSLLPSLSPLTMPPICIHSFPFPSLLPLLYPPSPFPSPFSSFSLSLSLSPPLPLHPSCVIIIGSSITPPPSTFPPPLTLPFPSSTSLFFPSPVPFPLIFPSQYAPICRNNHNMNTFILSLPFSLPLF